MGNKKVENNKGNDKNITIRLKKLTGTKIDAAKKNCSKKVRYMMTLYVWKSVLQ